MNTHIINEITQVLESLSDSELHQVHSYVKSLHTSSDSHSPQNRSENAALEKDKQPDQT
jgi:hypothetical protein